MSSAWITDLAVCKNELVRDDANKAAFAIGLAEVFRDRAATWLTSVAPKEMWPSQLRCGPRFGSSPVELPEWLCIWPMWAGHSSELEAD